MNGKIGFRQGAFAHDSYPYLLVGVRANVDLTGDVMMQVYYKGLTRPPATIADYAKNRFNKYSYCLYRVSDGVMLMWSHDFFNLANRVINPLAWELEGVTDEPTTA